MSSRSLIFFIKLLISGALIIFLVSATGFEPMIDRFRAISPGVVLLVLGLLFLQTQMSVARWIAVMRGVGVKLHYSQAQRILFVGLFFNQALPSSIGGDAMRVWYTRDAGHTLGKATGGVFLDRIAGFVAVIMIALVTLPWLSTVIKNPVAFWNISVAIVAAVIAIAVFLFFDRQPMVFRNYRIFRFIAELSRSARKLFFSFRALIYIFSVSIVIHFMTFLSIFILAQDMDIQLSFVECVVLIPPVLVLSMLPISIAGWGVREGAMVAALGFVHVPPEQALSLSVIFGLCLAAISLPGGVIWLALRNKQSPARTRIMPP